MLHASPRQLSNRRRARHGGTYEMFELRIWHVLGLLLQSRRTWLASWQRFQQHGGSMWSLRARRLRRHGLRLFFRAGWSWFALGQGLLLERRACLLCLRLGAWNRSAMCLFLPLLLCMLPLGSRALWCPYPNLLGTGLQTIMRRWPRPRLTSRSSHPRTPGPWGRGARWFWILPSGGMATHRCSRMRSRSAGSGA